MMLRPYFFLFAAAIAYAAPDRADLDRRLAAFAATGNVASRLEIHAATLLVGGPGESSDRAWWFSELRRLATSTRDPEVRAFLEGELRLDPSVATSIPLDPAPVVPAPYAPGQGPLATLVDAQRSLELGQRPALGPDELLAAVRGKDEELADRALLLLRRTAPSVAAPLLWGRLGSAKRRSEVLDWEEQILRLPLAEVGRGLPSAPPSNWSRSARAAWLRIVACRPGLRTDKEAVFPLLKGAADELTEAAWDAVPFVFSAADRPRLEPLLTGMSDRLAPRAREALARLR